MANLEEHILRIKGEGLDQIGQAADNTDDLRDSVDETESSLASMGKTAALAFGAFIIGTAIVGIAEMGIEMEQTRVSFETFLGSADKATQAISDLQEFSNVTPFDTGEVTKAGKVLLAFGTAQDKLIPTLRTIGDISAGTGKDFNELAVIYGKARVAGTLYAEDINQLVEAGVPIMGEFAKALGVTEGQVKKMASEGKLKFSDLETAFENLTGSGGLFFNLMEKQSQTVGGKLSTLVGKSQLLGIALGESMLPGLGVLADFALALIDNTELLKTIGLVVGIGAAAWALYNIPLAISIIQTKLLAAGQFLLNIALNANPIGLIVAGVALMAAGFLIAWRHSETFRAGIMGVWASMKIVFDNISGTFLNLPTLIIEAFQEIPQAFSDIFSGIGSVIKAVLTGDFAAIPDLLKEAGKNVLKSNPFTAVGLKVGQSLLAGTKAGFSKGFQDEIAASALEDAAAGEGALSTVSDPTQAIAGAETAKDIGVTTVSAKAPRVINITIGALVNEFTVVAENLNESANQVEAKVIEMFLKAVNDAQLSFR